MAKVSKFKKRLAPDGSAQFEGVAAAGALECGAELFIICPDQDMLEYVWQAMFGQAMTSPGTPSLLGKMTDPVSCGDDRRNQQIQSSSRKIPSAPQTSEAEVDGLHPQ